MLGELGITVPIAISGAPIAVAITVPGTSVGFGAGLAFSGTSVGTLGSSTGLSFPGFAL
jgi:hypothetical protein